METPSEKHVRLEKEEAKVRSDETKHFVVKEAHAKPTHDETVKAKEDRLARVAASAEDDRRAKEFESFYEPYNEAFNNTIAQLAEATKLVTASSLTMKKKLTPKVDPSVILSQLEGIRNLTTRILEYHAQLEKLLAF